MIEDQNEDLSSIDNGHDSDSTEDLDTSSEESIYEEAYLDPPIEDAQIPTRLIYTICMHIYQYIFIYIYIYIYINMSYHLYISSIYLYIIYIA